MTRLQQNDGAGHSRRKRKGVYAWEANEAVRCGRHRMQDS